VIELYQASWYQIVFPIESGGSNVADIIDAKLVIYRGLEAKLSLSIGSGLSFANSQITAILDELETVNLLGKYRSELWIVDLQNNPLFVRSDEFSFLPTKTRF
jgi:hypothetical protein